MSAHFRSQALAGGASVHRLAKLLGNYTANLVSRKLGLACDIDEKSCSYEVIYPAQMFDCKPALFMDGQLEKILQTPFRWDVAYEIENIKGGRRPLQPVTRLCVRNVFVTPKYIYSGRHRKIFSTRQKNRLLQNYKEVSSAALASSLAGCNYFGHWLRDDCNTFLLAAEAGDPIAMATPVWREKSEYSARFGQTWTPPAPVFCRQLSVYLDLGQNPHKAERFRRLRAKLRNSARTRGRSDMVYLMRGSQSSARSLTNEDEVVRVLERAGCYIYEAETGLANLEAAGLDARIMIGVEGSQLSHALYMLKDNGGLFVLQPPTRVFNSHLDWCRQLGMDYAFVVGDPDGNGFTIDIQVLERTLEKFDRLLG